MLFIATRSSYGDGRYERPVTTLVTDDFGMDVSDRVVRVQNNIGYFINERYARNCPGGVPEEGQNPEIFITIDSILARLKAHDKELYSVFEMKYFSELTLEEMMMALGKSKQRVRTLIKKAEAWVKEKS